MSISRVQQKLRVVALPYTSKFTLSNTAVTCWVFFPSPVLMSRFRVQQKLGVGAVPYTLMFMLLVVLANIIMYVMLIYNSYISYILHLFSVYTCVLDSTD